MTEHEEYAHQHQNEPDSEGEHAEVPFWNFDEPIAEARFFNDQSTIRLRTHISQECYSHATEGDELIPMPTRRGTRHYVLARPYILEPNYTLEVGIYPQPALDGAIGEVVSSEWTGMKQREIGQAQAWLYPQDRTLILWECFLNDWCRGQDPRSDETLQALWKGFEDFLMRHLPPVDRIVTPSWEPIVRRILAYQTYVVERGRYLVRLLEWGLSPLPTSRKLCVDRFTQRSQPPPTYWFAGDYAGGSAV